MTDRIGQTPPELGCDDDRATDQKQTDAVTSESWIDLDAAVAHPPGRTANAAGETEPDR